MRQRALLSQRQRLVCLVKRSAKTLGRTHLDRRVGHMNMKVGKFSVACRFLGSVLVVSPLAYWSTVENGDAYHFLALLLLAPLAGLVLFLNSLFCLFRYRTWKSAGVSLIFILLSPVGVVVTWHFLPQFKM